MQLMCRRTQYMQRRRFAAQHVFAEIYRHESALPCQAHFILRPIALRPDGESHGNGLSGDFSHRTPSVEIARLSRLLTLDW